MDHYSFHDLVWFLCVQCFEEWEKILKLLKSTVLSAEKGTECEAAETEALTDSTS